APATSAATVTLAAEVLATLQGTYWSPRTDLVRRIELRDGKLLYVRGPGNTTELAAVAPDRFVMEDCDLYQMYTSGTTGPPKGALKPHRVMLGNVPGFVYSHDFFPQPGDALWSPADWAWIGGLINALLAFWYHGIPIVGRFGTEFGNVYQGMKSGWNPEFKAFGLGHMVVGRLIEQALADGLVRIEYRDLPAEDRDLATGLEERHDLDLCAVADVNGGDPSHRPPDWRVPSSTA
ncbi:MAG: GNAT family N-acetyltransferase, partial [Leptolyngbyaceae cyanobacterium SU_3_3]|nr:GNAT family N-acetyltransferase [Leptolyngbyaceae cyanobacterium SU_3_3]